MTIAWTSDLPWADDVAWTSSSGVITATPAAGNAPPRVQITLALPTGYDSTDFTIVVTDPIDVTRIVRSCESITAGGESAWVGYDYEAPYGVPLTYGVVFQPMSGAPVGYTAPDITLSPSVAWLVHPGKPSLSIPLPRVRQMDTRTAAVNKGIFTPYGRTTPVIVTDGQRKAATTSIVVRTGTTDELDALYAILDDCTTLLLNIPPTLGWGITREYVNFDATTEDRWSYPSAPSRDVTMPYQVTSAPIGGSQAERTYATILTEASSYQAVLDQHGTYLDLLAPTG